MQISAEMRWFWADREFPDGLKSWFNNGTPKPGGGRVPPRKDQYLHDPTQKWLGIKKRDGKPGIEVKGLIASGTRESDVQPFVGQIELWCKWTSDALSLGSQPTILIEKLRWLRKLSFDIDPAKEIALDENERPSSGQGFPKHGCNIELTKIELPSRGRLWWTLGFEAFGELETVEGTLRRTLELTTKRQAIPSLGKAEPLSYPAWLGKYNADPD